MHNLSVTNIHKSYGNNDVLRGVSLTANKGDVISVIGSSGSGKSTFLRCINLLEQPSSGSISLGDENLSLSPCKRNRNELTATCRKQLQRFRSRLGMVFQHFNLWSHMTALENICSPLIHVLKLSKSEAQERARVYLKKVGLDEQVESKFPSQLSGGQQQRVAIARALALEPEVLLFDEPTSALDPELVGEVLRVMQALAEEGRTMIVVTHEMEFARNVSNHLVFLHQGLVEEEGDPTEVLSNPQSQRLTQFLSGRLK